MSVVVIRADASSTLGGGHIYRCLTLADELTKAGLYVHFICRVMPGHLALYILSRGFGVSLIASKNPMTQLEDAQICRTLLESLMPTLVIVDHYELDRQWQNALAPLSQFMMVIDDLADRHHDCDLLFDQSLGRSPKDYQDKISQRCQKLITGAKHALLRPEFVQLASEARRKRENTQTVEKVLISMGATDPLNVTMAVLPLLDLERWQITVVLTDKAPHLAEVKSYVADTNIKLLVNVSDMAQQILDADVAIAAAGTSMLERCALGLPSVIICMADNQRHIAQACDQSGCAISVLETHQIVSQLIDSLNHFLQSPKGYQQIAQKAFAVCNGQGVKYLVAQIEDLFLTQRVWLKPVMAQDMSLLYQWQQAPQTRRFARDPKPPTLQQHKRWFVDTIKDPHIHFYLIMYGATPCGFVRLNPAKEGFEVSIALAPHSAGKGLGTQALELLGQLQFEKTLLAFIAPENRASVKAFNKAGFQPLADNWYQLIRN